jgi:hypothetical protein
MPQGVVFRSCPMAPALFQEGRRLLRALIRGFPNGETRPFRSPERELTWGTETSKYPEERTSTETPLVVASERGPGQWPGCKNENNLEKLAIAGDSPVSIESTQVLE